MSSSNGGLPHVELHVSRILIIEGNLELVYSLRDGKDRDIHIVQGFMSKQQSPGSGMSSRCHSHSLLCSSSLPMLLSLHCPRFKFLDALTMKGKGFSQRKALNKTLVQIWSLNIRGVQDSSLTEIEQSSHSKEIIK